MTKPFRFAVQGKTAASATEWTELARRCEGLGYSTLTLPDHFDGQLAPTPALATAAAVTRDLKIGALVYCNDYRHPVVLASEAATLDLLSDGRLELGIGAGWMTTDYDATGITHDRAGVRIDRMIESLQILKGLFADGAFSFNGDHYRIADLDLQPKPVQRPLPILIGGGARRMLRLAGQHADIVGVNLNLSSGVIDANTIGDGVPERFVEKIGWIKEGAGDRFDDIELHIRTHYVIFTDDRTGLAETVGGSLGLTANQALGSPAALLGDPHSMIDDLRQRRESLGFSYVTIGADEMDQFAPVVAELAGT